jgi:Mor family transcriptional regulator
MTCYRCDHEFAQGEEYYLIIGESYCRECRDEWIKDEFAENFEQYAEQVAEIMGIHTWTYGEF